MTDTQTLRGKIIKELSYTSTLTDDGYPNDKNINQITDAILVLFRQAVNGLHYVCEEDRHIDGNCRCNSKNEALDDVVKLLS